MVEFTSPGRPLAIYPESDFVSFYAKLSERLGFKPSARITALEPVAWQEMSALIAKGDYDAVVRMADSRDPTSSLNSIVLEIPGYNRSFHFGKILADGKPMAVCLSGEVSAEAGTGLIPAELAEGSAVRATRFENVGWLGIQAAAAKYGIESLLKEDFRVGRAKTAFLSILEGVFRKLQEHHPEAYAKLFDKDTVTIGDIGCGMMPYGAMLAYYFMAHGKHVVVVGIDGEASEGALNVQKREALELKPEGKADFVAVPRWLGESAEHIKGNGIKYFDLITLFNPRPGDVGDVIDIGNLPLDLRRSALFLAAPDDSYGIDDFVGGDERQGVIGNLHENGYMVLFEALNPHIRTMVSVGHKYNPIIVAQRLEEVLNSQSSRKAQ